MLLIFKKYLKFDFESYRAQIGLEFGEIALTHIYII